MKGYTNEEVLAAHDLIMTRIDKVPEGMGYTVYIELMSRLLPPLPTYWPTNCASNMTATEASNPTTTPEGE